MKTLSTVLLLTLLGSVAVARAEGAVRYTITDLGISGSTAAGSFSPRGINDSGQIVGTKFLPDSDYHAFLYDSGTGETQDLGSLVGSGGASTANAINGLGQIVGWGYNSVHRMHAFLYEGSGPMQDLGFFGQDDKTEARAINDQGQIVGTYSLTSSSTSHAFIINGTGPIQPLGTLDTVASEAVDINNLGQIVGSAIFGGATHAYLYEADGTLKDLGSLGGNSWANAINQKGQVAGGYYATIAGYSSYQRAVLYRDGDITPLGTLGGTTSNAVDINDDGLIVGASTLDTSASHAFAVDSRNGLMRDLNMMIDPSLGWTLTSATEINNQGQIVGAGVRNGSNHAFLLTPASYRTLTWNAIDGTWDTAIPTPCWSDGTATTTYQEGDDVKFDQVAGGAIAVGPNGVAPGLMEVANSGGLYAFHGGEISGTLFKSNSGTVRLQSPNNFDLVAVMGGTLETQAGYSLGQGQIRLGNGATWKALSTQTQAAQLYVATGGGTIDVPGRYILTLTNTANFSTDTLNKTGTGTLVLPMKFGESYAAPSLNVLGGIVRTGSGVFSNSATVLHIADGATVDASLASPSDCKWWGLSGAGTYMVAKGTKMTIARTCTFDGRVTAGMYGVVGSTPDDRAMTLVVGTRYDTSGIVPVFALTGTSDFAGQVTVESGTLSFASIGNRGEPSSLGVGNITTTSTSGSTDINIIGQGKAATLQYTGPTASSDRTIAFGSYQEFSMEIVDPNATLSLSSPLAPLSRFKKLGQGTLEITGANTFKSDLFVVGGTLKGNTQSLRAPVTLANDSNVTFNQTSDGEFTYAISGAGSLTKMGSAVLTLSGTNSFTGQALVSGGTLQGTTTSLPTAVMLANGANVTFNQASDATLTKAISGTGSLTKAGNGTLLVAAAASYQGSTIIDGGTLRVGLPSPGPVAGAALWLDASTLNLANGAAVTSLTDLGTSRNNAVVSGGAPTFTPAGLNGLGTIHFDGAQALVTQRNLGITGGASRSMFVVMRRNGSSTTGTLAVQTGNDVGEQAWGLSSQHNWFGTYVAAPGSAEGSPRAAGVFELYDSIHQNGVPSGGGTNYIYANGSLIGTGSNMPDINTVSAPLAIGVGPICASASGDFAELLVYNSYLNETQRRQVEAYLTAKWLSPVANNFLPTTTAMTVAGSATFDLNAQQTIGSLSGQGNVTLGSNGVLTVNSSADSMFAGVISGFGGTLTKTGPFALTLSGWNTYSGPTTVGGGTLVVNSSLASPIVSVNAGGSLGGKGAIVGKVTVAGGSSPSGRGAINLVDSTIGKLTLSDPKTSETALSIGSTFINDPSLFHFEVGESADSIDIPFAKLVVNNGGAMVQISPLEGFHAGVYDLITFQSGQASGLDRLVLETTTLPGYELHLESTPTAERLVVMAVPEPSTLALLGAAGLLVFAWRRRRKAV